MKNLLFQVPALLRGLKTQKLTVVITPLRALMRDQVVSLWTLGFNLSVDYLSGDREPWENAEVYQGILDNRIKLLFVAPERFRVNRFREALQRRHHTDGGLEYIVVDEAHCISQWGFEFRPDYLFAIDEICRCFRMSHNVTRILFFSATVTQRVEQTLRAITRTSSTEFELLIRPEKYQHPIQEFIQLKTEAVTVPLYGEREQTELLSRGGELERIIQKAGPDTHRSIVIVFVTRRRDAESIAGYLRYKLPPNFKVAHFHAGLPPSERLHIYDDVKGGHINVLVATKAFGMGMDIPNIHWCIHLAPPSFLEDYLQEVGRTGRSKGAREEASLDNVECTLLHHADDFARNHELVQRGKITPPDLVALWNEIMRRSATTLTNRLISVLPSDGYEGLTGDKLRKALSWLERKPAERLSILGFLPNILRLQLNKETLREVAQRGDPPSAVARVLLRLYEEPTNDVSRQQPATVAEAAPQSRGLWEFLRTFLGFLVKPKPGVEDAQIVAARKGDQRDKNEAEVKLDTLLFQAQLERIDDVYLNLFRLQQMGALQILRRLSFSDGSNRQQASILWEWVGALTSDLVQPYPAGRELQPEELQAILEDQRSDMQNQTQLSPAIVKRCIRAVVRLCNVSGMCIRERVNAEDALAYHYTLANETLRYIKRQIQHNISIAKQLADLLDKSDRTNITLASLLQLLDEQCRIKNLKAGIRLLSDLKIFTIDQPLVSFNYLLEIKTRDELLDASADGIREVDRKMYEELGQVNRIAELRSFVMELYAQSAEEDDPRSFIDEYFKATTPDDLEALIGRTVGNLDDPDIPEALKSIMRKVRQEAMNEALDELHCGDEPNQFRACTIPWNQNLLVNAGPGAGKTKVLMTRAAHLIHKQGLQPEQILIMAFNRAVVYEIKARIKHLFDGLGYGAYVRRLRVRTFHSFALENFPHEGGPLTDERIDTLFRDFVQCCIDNRDFAVRVTADIRAILVDEFQDMGDDRYALLKALQQASGASLMAIGDDDQDILRWNRCDNPIEAREYFQRFEQDFPEAQKVNLAVNFRSDQQIVRRSQRLLTNVLANLSSRIKSDVVLNSRHDAAEGTVVDNFSIESLTEILQDAQESQRDVAILCRTNFEAYKRYESLRPQFPHVQIQGRENLKLNRLRHIGKWLDICDDLIEAEGDLPMSPETFQKICATYEGQCIPEVTQRSNQQEYIYLNFLWDATLEENPRATLRYHIGLVRELSMDDYLRMQGRTELPKWREKLAAQGNLSKILISTIHKVKGLEFDTVIIMPSTSNLKENERADEARLFYVGMTRAKHRLYFAIKQRERCWIDGNGSFESERSGIYLTGSPREVFISWPGLDKSNHQAYIESDVGVGDTLELHFTKNGKAAFKHNNGIIGLFSSEEEVGKLTPQEVEEHILRVHCVYRYPINEDTLEQFPNILDECTRRGWLYTVLVSGIIREKQK